MTTTPLERQFAKMGARITVAPSARPPRLSRAGREQRPDYHIDVERADRSADGSFVIRAFRSVDPIVLNLDAKHRHLLLKIGSDRYLCGHDERHWFVAGVPNTVTTVRDAILALRPERVEQPRGRRKLFKRRTKGYVRQGEWFFVPAPDLTVPTHLILREEPIRRGRNKPHMCQELYRTGGETVVVCQHHPNGITLDEWEAHGELTEHLKTYRICVPRTMQRNAIAYARGKVSHPDHATIVLHGWHRVVGNQETTPEPMAFLD